MTGAARACVSARAGARMVLPVRATRSQALIAHVHTLPRPQMLSRLGLPVAGSQAGRHPVALWNPWALNLPPCDRDSEAANHAANLATVTVRVLGLSSALSSEPAASH